jgi:hypothetical protein
MEKQKTLCVLCEKSLPSLLLKGQRKKQDTIQKKNVRVQRRFITKKQEKNDK